MSEQRSVEDTLRLITDLRNDFTPDEMVVWVRSKLTDDDGEMHIIMDVVETLWDEVQRLRRLLDQSKGESNDAA